MLQLWTEGALAEELPTAGEGIPGNMPQLRNLWPQCQVLPQGQGQGVQGRQGKGKGGTGKGGIQNIEQETPGTGQTDDEGGS
eukprot:4620056-Alexandrium_andersonii.AAC.1